MLVHAGLCEGGVGGAPEAAPEVPPTSHRPGLPSPWQVVTSGSLQAWSRCAAERRTGMRLWENTSPSSSRSVPARSTSPVPALPLWPGSSANLSGAPSPGMTWCW